MWLFLHYKSLSLLMCHLPHFLPLCGSVQSTNTNPKLILHIYSLSQIFDKRINTSLGMSSVKLFGWTISSASHSHDPLSSSLLPNHGKQNHSLSSLSCSLSLRPHMMNNQSTTDNNEQDHTSHLISSKESKETSENSDDQHSEITTTTTTSEEKTTDLKKPDKILPCPRCNSSDTKFCYYNNYNVNQPRHFCRNCQRYWTSGGTMRTVPVGSGRRKNKGWLSSENTSNDYTHNYNTSSSTKILCFESSGSLVTENNRNHSSNAATNVDSVSLELNNFQGFLPPQVTSPVSPPWPYQYASFNPSFYHMPIYCGFTVSTEDTSTCQGKRTRDEDSHENAKESKDSFVRARLDSTKNHVWYPVPMSSNVRFVPETYLNLQANPAAMARSMNFMESM